jgi:hypothetical protein
MSQSIRRVFAVTGLVAALLLSIPAPSRAAGLRGQAPAAAGFVTRAWSWLESLLARSGPVASTQRTAIQQKDAPFPTPLPPPSGTVRQGNMIDPDGAMH